MESFTTLRRRARSLGLLLRDASQGTGWAKPYSLIDLKTNQSVCWLRDLVEVGMILDAWAEPRPTARTPRVTRVG